MAKRNLSIEYVPLEEVRRWPRNPKEHDLGAIHSSIARFGFVNPLIVNEATGELLVGHGRLDTLEQRFQKGELPPDGIVTQNGTWLVPVVRGISLPSEEATAYAIADNRLTELGGWNDAQLAEILQEIDLKGVGFDDDDVDRLLNDLKGLPTLLEGPEVEGEDTRTGQLILLYQNQGERLIWLTKLGLENLAQDRILLKIKDLGNSK